MTLRLVAVVRRRVASTSMTVHLEPPGPTMAAHFARVILYYAQRWQLRDGNTDRMARRHVRPEFSSRNIYP